MKLNKVLAFQICQIHLNCFGRTPTFLLLKNSLKNASFQVSLPLDKLLIATLSKTCALTASTYVAEERMTIPNLSETLRLLCSKSKNEEWDQSDLNMSDQFESVIPCSTNESTTFNKN